MSGNISSTGFTPTPMPTWQTNLPTATANTPAAPTYTADSLSTDGRVTAAGGAGPDYNTVAQELQNASPQVRYQGVIDATKLPPAQAIQLLTPASQQQQDPQLAQLAQRAIGVLQQMPGNAPASPVAGNNPYQPQQFAPQQYAPQQYAPQQQFAPQQYAPQQQYMPQQQFAPQQSAMPYQPAVNMSNVNPNDAQFMLQTLQTDLGRGGNTSLQAVQQLAALATAQPAIKDAVFNLLLNHIYYKRDISTVEALKYLASTGDQRLLPYFQAVQRDGSYLPDARQIALAAMQSQMLSAPGQPGVASVNGAQNVDYIRAQEYELQKAGPAAEAAMGQIRNALGQQPNMAMQSPAGQEVLRVLLTHISTSHYEPTVLAAIQMLGAMGTRQMDTLRYLDAVKRDGSQTPAVQQAAAAAIQQIMASPGP